MTDATGAASLVRTIEQVTGGPLGLDVSADLTVAVAGHELAVEAYTDRVIVEFPSMGAVVDVLRSTPESSGGDGSLAEMLDAADLTTVARVGGRDVATMGDASGLLAYAGYESVRLHPRGLVLAALGV